MKPLLVLTLAILLSARSAPIAAQSVGSADVLHASVTIDAIDSATRTVTFHDASGHKDTITAPPEVKRFDELKVGDQLNFTYYYARIFELRKTGPGAEPKPTGTGGDGTTKVTPTDSPLPGGTVTRRATESVWVKSTDLNQGLISVVRPDGRVLTRKVQDPSLMQGVVADDRIDVTYAEGLLVDVERP
jgi:hypothetical protein